MSDGRWAGRWSRPGPGTVGSCWWWARRGSARHSCWVSPGTWRRAATCGCCARGGPSWIGRFGFGLVRGLLERAVGRAAGGAGGDARTGGGGVRRRPPAAHGPEPDLFARLLGLYWLVAELSARQPLVMVADDLHWADTASLRWLVFMAERVDDLPVLMVCATRPDEPGCRSGATGCADRRQRAGHPSLPPLGRGDRRLGPRAHPRRGR